MSDHSQDIKTPAVRLRGASSSSSSSASSRSNKRSAVIIHGDAPSSSPSDVTLRHKPKPHVPPKPAHLQSKLQVPNTDARILRHCVESTDISQTAIAEEPAQSVQHVQLRNRHDTSHAGDSVRSKTSLASVRSNVDSGLGTSLSREISHTLSSCDMGTSEDDQAFAADNEGIEATAAAHSQSLYVNDGSYTSHEQTHASKDDEQTTAASDDEIYAEPYEHVRGLTRLKRIGTGGRG